MSTRGSTWWDEPVNQEWTPLPKLWCKYCCTSGCGCSEGDRLEALRAQHYEGMGSE